MNEIPKIIIILRGYTLEETEHVARAVIESGLNEKFGLEITSNSPEPFKTISYLVNQYGNKISIGAGTILNMNQAKKAVEAGAKYILSPVGLNKKIINYCRSNDVLTVPAAYTPTEIKRQFELGADVVKVFPAATVGPKFFKDVQAPLGKLDLMAVGGVSLNNIKEFINNEVKYLGIGSSMFNEEDVVNNAQKELMETLIEFNKTLDN